MTFTPESVEWYMRVDCNPSIRTGAMEQSVYLITNSDEVLLGTVDEIMHGANDNGSECLGMSFAAAISDIVAGIISSTDVNCRLFAIGIR